MSSSIYELKYSGREVDDAITKINDFDPSSITGGIVELESSGATPYNLDFLRSPGLYKAAFVYVLSCPSGVENCTPVIIFVYKIKDNTPNGRLVQSLYAGDAVFNRESDDAGVNWTRWESKDGLDKASEITPADIDRIYDSVFHASSLDPITLTAIWSKVSSANRNESTDNIPIKQVSC